MTLRSRALAVLAAACLLAAAGCEQLNEMFGRGQTAAQKAAVAMSEAGTLLEQGKLEAAEAAYRKVLTHDPMNGAAVLALATIYEQRGEDTRAALELRNAQMLMPTDPDPRERLGDIMMRQGRVGSAVEAYAGAFDLRPGETRLRRKLAWAMLRDGDVQGASRELTEVLAADPSDSQAEALRGLVMAAEGRVREARSHIDTSVRLSADPGAAVVQGIFYLQQGQASSAVQAFRTAMDRGARDPQTLRLLADALIESGQGVEAVEVLQPTVDARPHDPMVLAAYARALVARGQYEDALKAADQAVRLDPKLGAAWLAKGEALEAGGQQDAAIAAYRSAVKNSPTADAFRRLGNLYRDVGRNTDAADAFERLLVIEPGDRRAAVALAELYLGSPTDAKRGLELVDGLLREDPGEPRLMRLRRELTEQAKNAPRGTPRNSGGNSGPMIIRGGR